MATTAAPLDAAPERRERHPPALPTIFFTEMWERFSYYGMRALLVLYLVNALGFQRSDALELYGMYTGLVYLSPLVGGYRGWAMRDFRRTSIASRAVTGCT